MTLSFAIYRESCRRQLRPISEQGEAANESSGALSVLWDLAGACDRVHQPLSHIAAFFPYPKSIRSSAKSQTNKKIKKRLDFRLPIELDLRVGTKTKELI
jgi:hypothetical protein